MESTNRVNKNFVQYLIAMIAACLVFGIMQGTKDNYGVMMNGIVEHTKISYASVSFAIGVGQILYGVTQPIFAMIALKKSNAFVLSCGIILMAMGLIVTPFCTETWSMFLFFGVVLPTGTGALCLGVVMGAISPIIGEKRAAAASGIIQASAGIGDALMAPALQRLTEWRGITVSMPIFSIPILLMIPMIVWFSKSDKKSKSQEIQNNNMANTSPTESLTDILRFALHDRTYWCLLIGFSTCGFHMSIIETHLFSQYLSNGVPPSLTAFALTIYGITTMLGAVATGFLGRYFRMKNVLGSVYGIRILIAIAFIFMPKSVPFAFIATAALGLTGDSTVPPTMGIISQKVGLAKMAVLYGALCIGHQIGAFASAWLGGILVNTPLSYTALWIADLCLCSIASFVSFHIKD